MGKIKVNLASGNVFEKPLVTCFQGTSANYIVFDNEMNGSMGLPIICISKLNGDKLEKIYDQSEWASVKENLKSIISGNTLLYIAPSEVLTAQDDFFTQLTLPVASFDVLKNSYKPPVIQNVEPTPNLNVGINDSLMGNVPNVEAINNDVNQVSTPINVVETPAFTPNAPAPENQPMMQDMSAFTPNVPVNLVNPVNTVENTSANDYSDLKETFMKSCENMFDALVKKFENK